MAELPQAVLSEKSRQNRKLIASQLLLVAEFMKVVFCNFDVRSPDASKTPVDHTFDFG
jgi:hypothetical protein